MYRRSPRCQTEPSVLSSAPRMRTRRLSIRSRSCAAAPHRSYMRRLVVRSSSARPSVLRSSCSQIACCPAHRKKSRRSSRIAAASFHPLVIPCQLRGTSSGEAPTASAFWSQSSVSGFRRRRFVGLSAICWPTSWDAGSLSACLFTTELGYSRVRRSQPVWGSLRALSTGLLAPERSAPSTSTGGLGFCPTTCWRLCSRGARTGAGRSRRVGRNRRAGCGLPPRLRIRTHTKTSERSTARGPSLSEPVRPSWLSLRRSELPEARPSPSNPSADSGADRRRRSVAIHARRFAETRLAHRKARVVHVPRHARPEWHLRV